MRPRFLVHGSVERCCERCATPLVLVLLPQWLPSLITIPVTTCLLILITYIIFGAVLFAAWEGWNYMDGAYFCFTSLMTIGFGDFVPGNKYIYNVGDNVTEQVLSLPLT